TFTLRTDRAIAPVLAACSHHANPRLGAVLDGQTLTAILVADKAAPAIVAGGTLVSWDLWTPRPGGRWAPLAPAHEHQHPESKPDSSHFPPADGLPRTSPTWRCIAEHLG